MYFLERSKYSWFSNVLCQFSNDIEDIQNIIHFHSTGNNFICKTVLNVTQILYIFIKFVK